MIQPPFCIFIRICPAVRLFPTVQNGTNDFIVDIKYSEQAVEKYPSAVLYPIQGASHGFNNANLNGMASFVGGEKDDVVMPYVFRFLEEHIWQ